MVDARFERIAVVGTSCSGKTTLARRLAGLLAAPHVELDALHWAQNWTPRPLEEFRALAGAAVAAPRWVADGNYAAVRDLVWARATAVVWLNYSFPVVFGRALRRTLRRVLRREELYGGNRESFVRSFLSRESLLWWVISTHRDRRRRYTALFRSPECAHLELVELRQARDAEHLCERLACLGQELT